MLYKGRNRFCIPFLFDVTYGHKRRNPTQSCGAAMGIHFFFCAVDVYRHHHQLPAHAGILIFLFSMCVGAAATLLATAFESWMVTEHHSRGYPSHLLADTFRMATWGIGLATIVSGFAAEASVKGMGLLAPFNLAIGVINLRVALLVSWMAYSK